MNAALLTLSLCFGQAGGNDLSWKSFDLVKIRIPMGWYHQRKSFFSGRLVSKSSDVYSAPSGDAFITVDVDAVKAEGGMSAEACRQEILQRLHPQDVTLLKVDRKPAAMWEEEDYIFHANTFAIRTYVGCDGQTVWAVNFHFQGSSRVRYEAMAREVGQSVRYVAPVSEVNAVRSLESRVQRSSRGR